NKVDHFFRDKLENHALPPPEEAWAKIEASLSKKNNVAVWRVAAAILVAGALISILIWSQRSSEKKSPVIAEKKTRPNNSVGKKPAPQAARVEKKATHAAPQKSLTVPVAPPLRVEEQNKVLAADKTLPPEQKVGVNKSVAVNDRDQSSFAKVPENNPSFAKASEDKQENKKFEATQAAAVASTRQKPIKLEFTLEGFPSEPVAAVNETKSSGLKKVWELALEVKNGDGPVHEIKNELFALNFKKNKNQH
ncbi:MAG TPA: hypothetical protein VKQ08_02365, partial [Cyclobacteriaceae bacterium]|nr:hypothetical protein [Cyclobacteriaceae bacterium]